MVGVTVVCISTGNLDHLFNISDLVLKLLIAGSDSDEAKNALEELKDIQKSAIELALNFEKPGIVKAD